MIYYSLLVDFLLKFRGSDRVHISSSRCDGNKASDHPITEGRDGKVVECFFWGRHRSQAVQKSSDTIPRRSHLRRQHMLQYVSLSSPSSKPLPIPATSPITHVVHYYTRSNASNANRFSKYSIKPRIEIKVFKTLFSVLVWVLRDEMPFWLTNY